MTQIHPSVRKSVIETLEQRRLLAAFTVTSAADIGAGSLRDVIAASNANGEADTIAFDASLAGSTISVTDELLVTDPAGLTITAPEGGLTLDGGGSTRILSLGANTFVTVDGLTFTGGDGVSSGTPNTPSANGGAINAIDGGTFLTVLNSTFTGNTAENGGAINVDAGDLSISNSTFTGNTADAAAPQRPDGGAIRVLFGTFNISDSVVSGNDSLGDPSLVSRSGGIYLVGPDVAAAGGPSRLVSGNETAPRVSNKADAAVVNGAAVEGENAQRFLTPGEDETLPGVRYNAGGRLIQGAFISIVNTEINNNSATDIGGGLTIFSGADGVPASTNIIGSDLSGNTLTGSLDNPASGAGAFLDAGPLFVKDTLISGNDATATAPGAVEAFGGGVNFQNVELATFVNTTVTQNIAGNRGGFSFNTFGTLADPFASFISFINTTITENQATIVVPDGPDADVDDDEAPGGVVFQGAGDDFGEIDSYDIVLYNTILAGNLGFTGIVPDDAAAGLPDTDPGQDFGNDIGTTAGTDAGFFLNQAPNITGTQFSPDPEDVFFASNFPLLAPLGDYGGPTQTQPPLSTDSLAFNAGNNDFALDPGDDIIIADEGLFDPVPVDDDSALVTDQRQTTPRIVYDNVDIGAAEYRLAGDANLDGDVNLTDFLVLRDNFNQEGIFSDGDFNGDGDINLTDFLILRENFNASIFA